jgi:hypothetical protein
MSLRLIPARALRLFARNVHRAAVSALALLQASCTQTPSTVLDHNLVFQRYKSPTGSASLTIRPLMAQPGASVIIASVGRGQFTAFTDPPSGSSGPFRQIGPSRTYTQWPKSGTALYLNLLQEGNQPATMTVLTPREDEVTVAAVAVAGKRVQDWSWVERDRGFIVKSGSVTTTGKATLIAFWWGDRGEDHRKIAASGDGFRIVNSILEEGALVQCAVAVKEVDRAGTYSVTWYAWPLQGAQLWLVAVE